MCIKLIAFDIGGVLASVERLKTNNNYLFDNIFLDLQRGHICPDYFIKNKTSYGLNKLLFLHMLKAHQNIKLLKKLAVPYIFASNINSLHYEKFISESAPSAYALANSVLSFQINYLKPERNFFELIKQITKIRASKILFIDDKLENIDAALKSGLTARWCPAPKDLSTLLADFGLLISS